MKECGFRIDYEAMARWYTEATHGKGLKESTIKWFDSMAPFLALAYQAGANDLPLAESFPFMEPAEE